MPIPKPRSPGPLWRALAARRTTTWISKRWASRRRAKTLRRRRTGRGERHETHRPKLMGRMGWMPNRATGRPMVEEGLAPAPVYRSRAGSGSDGARGVLGCPPIIYLTVRSVPPAKRRDRPILVRFQRLSTRASGRVEIYEALRMISMPSLPRSPAEMTGARNLWRVLIFGPLPGVLLFQSQVQVKSTQHQNPAFRSELFQRFDDLIPRLPTTMI